MIILHCLAQSAWEQCKDRDDYGQAYLEQCGFIHCSEVATYALVAPNFKDI